MRRGPAALGRRRRHWAAARLPGRRREAAGSASAAAGGAGGRPVRRRGFQGEARSPSGGARGCWAVRTLGAARSPRAACRLSLSAFSPSRRDSTRGRRRSCAFSCTCRARPRSASSPRCIRDRARSCRHSEWRSRIASWCTPLMMQTTARGVAGAGRPAGRVPRPREPACGGAGNAD